MNFISNQSEKIHWKTPYSKQGKFKFENKFVLNSRKYSYVYRVLMNGNNNFERKWQYLWNFEGKWKKMHMIHNFLLEIYSHLNFFIYVKPSVNLCICWKSVKKSMKTKNNENNISNKIKWNVQNSRHSPPDKETLHLYTKFCEYRPFQKIKFHILFQPCIQKLLFYIEENFWMKR